MIADDFLFVVFTVSVNVVLWYWEYDHVVLVMLFPRASSVAREGAGGGEL